VSNTLASFIFAGLSSTIKILAIWRPRNAASKSGQFQQASEIGAAGENIAARLPKAACAPGTGAVCAVVHTGLLRLSAVVNAFLHLADKSAVLPAGVSARNNAQPVACLACFAHFPVQDQAMVLQRASVERPHRNRSVAQAGIHATQNDFPAEVINPQ
jgi:hypothetical protein